jgi:hypothetical protein
MVRLRSGAGLQRRAESRPFDYSQQPGKCLGIAQPGSVLVTGRLARYPRLLPQSHYSVRLLRGRGNFRDEFHGSGGSAARSGHLAFTMLSQFPMIAFLKATTKRPASKAEASKNMPGR